MSETWFQSDLHLAHVRIIQYSERPFRDVDHMNEELIERHNALVKPDDIVIDVGDFSMNRLHGRRTLVCGNHDRCWRKHSAAEKWARRYVAWGFARVLQQLEMEIAGHKVLIDHMPYREDVTRHEKYKDFRPVDKGLPLIHGHVHKAWAERDLMYNVGVDVRDYKPVHIDEITQWLKSATQNA
jgi:calcineurin-like phosphoesterase family protein